MLNELGAELHQEAKEKGFWEGDSNPAEKLMLIVSELSEALEEMRAGHLPSEARTVWHSTPHSRDLSDITVNHEGSFLWYGTGAQRKVEDSDFIAAGWLPKPEGVPSEMADVIIRTLETASAWGIDIDAAVAEKRAYNKQRGHMNGGKRF